MAFYEQASSSSSSSLSTQPDEHTFLCGYNRVRRYGTTKSLQDTTPQHYFIYTVQTTDTLEGISLRHNCSVSEIVRLNKLWSAQALHLKETIRIPLKGENDQPLSAVVTKPVEVRNGTPDPPAPSESLNDILSRIDKSIKKTSKSVRTMERHSPSLHHLDQGQGSPRRHNSLENSIFVSKSRVT